MSHPVPTFEPDNSYPEDIEDMNLMTEYDADQLLSRKRWFNNTIKHLKGNSMGKFKDTLIDTDQEDQTPDGIEYRWRMKLKRLTIKDKSKPQKVSVKII